jgi:hypothetical protein
MTSSRIAKQLAVAGYFYTGDYWDKLIAFLAIAKYHHDNII